MAFEDHSACADVRIVDRDHAIVEVTPKRDKVAIVGFATNTLHLVPWFDPSFEIWGLNQGYIQFHRRADRWFEMHLPEATPDVRDPNYLAFLGTCGLPIYMLQTYEEYPTSIRYPIEAAINWVGMDYFTSSIAYMMVLAAMEGFKEIHIYGVNLAIGEEYTYEKPNAEFLIGLMRGRGFKVFIPQASSLLKQYRRYGYSIDPRPNQGLRAMIDGRIAEYNKRYNEHHTNLNQVIGAMGEAQALRQILEGVDAGAEIVMMPPPAAPPAGQTSSGSSS